VTIPGAAKSGPIALSTLRRFAWHQPEWWVAGVIASAWSGVALAAFAGRAGEADHFAGHAVARAGGVDWTLEVGWLSLMAVAMMAPLTLPTLRHLSLTSLWSRRHRAQALFLAGYLGTWVAASAVIAAAIETIEAGPGRVVMTGSIFAIAAMWQFAETKRRALRRCSRTVAIGSRGWRADRDCVCFGVENAASCVITCWGFMAAVAAAGHSLGVMAVLFIVQLHERIVRRYLPVKGAVLVAAVGAWSLAMAAPMSA
jgi:predicted metal-binding membrane protein